MDSLTQMALGSAVGVAVMRRRVPVWRAAVVGAAFGTLPDLDAFVDYGDPISNVTYHRGTSHALFYLALLSPLLAWLVTRWTPRGGFQRWWLATALILLTHVLIDAMTVYGTQLGHPFTDHPFGVASVFIIDPLYTLPLLLGLVWAFRGSLRANDIGLGVSTVYLLWSVLAQAWVTHKVEQQFETLDASADQVLVVPTAFNTLLWRVLVVGPEHYWEGFYALADGDRPIHFDRFARGMEHFPAVADQWGVQRVAWFTKGSFALQVVENRLRITDLRMGQEPFYSFNFAVAERDDQGGWRAIPAELEIEQPDIAAGLSWIAQRALGKPLPPPRAELTEGVL